MDKHKDRCAICREEILFPVLKEVVDKETGERKVFKVCNRCQKMMEKFISFGCN